MTDNPPLRPCPIPMTLLHISEDEKRLVYSIDIFKMGDVADYSVEEDYALGARLLTVRFKGYNPHSPYVSPTDEQAERWHCYHHLKAENEDLRMQLAAGNYAKKVMVSIDPQRSLPDVVLIKTLEEENERLRENLKESLRWLKILKKKDGLDGCLYNLLAEELERHFPKAYRELEAEVIPKVEEALKGGE